MKNYLLIALSVLLTTSALFGQITITTAEFPEVGVGGIYGNYAFNRFDSAFSLLLDPKTKNFTIDLSDFKPTRVDTQTFLKPSNLLGGSSIPSAEFGLKTNLSDIYFAKKANVLELVGMGAELPTVGTQGFELKKPMSYVIAPMNIDDTYRDSSSSEKNLGLATLTLYINSYYNVDGYGTLKVPGGKTYDVLRVKRYNKVRVEAISILGNRYIYDSIISWDFYANGIQTVVMRVEKNYYTDGVNITDTLTHVSWLHDVPTSNNAGIQSEQYGLIAFNNGFVVHSELPADYTKYAVYTLNGQLITEQNVAANQFHSLSWLQDGLYVVRVTNPENGLMQTTKLLIAH